jgi:hypothetical protein
MTFRTPEELRHARCPTCGSASASFQTRFDQSSRTLSEQSYLEQLQTLMGDDSQLTPVEQAQNFPMYTPRQDLTRFLCRHEVFQRALKLQGAIVECGCLFGGGVMTWAQLSAIYEPFNHGRRIIGFDTFEGHKGVCAADGLGRDAETGGSGANATARPQGPGGSTPPPSSNPEVRDGGLAVDAEAELRSCVRLYDLNRPIGHIPRVEIVRGDACETIPDYLARNPHTLVSLLFLDFDIYEPTKTALQFFLPRMAKGSIVAFDELSVEAWPGETAAYFWDKSCYERLGRLQRFQWGPLTCFAEVL